MRFLIFYATSLVMGNEMVRIAPRSHPDSLVAIVKAGEKDTVRVVSTKENRKIGKSQEGVFEINKGMTEILQGKTKLCKDEKRDDIKVCTGNDEVYSKWSLVSENGSVRFKTENDICLEVEDKKTPEGIKLVGKRCKLNSPSQLFDLKFVEEESQDSNEIEFDKSSQKDLPLEELLPFLLKQSQSRAPATKQRIILYDGEGKKIVSFKGSVSPLLIASLSSGILPHSSTTPTPYSAYRPLTGTDAGEDVAVTPNYADYVKYY
ncbi:hypothetical protein M970_082020 [Encephalitozoon cuniculi EcunIII-L]|uniref:Uncharacterized protein n=1 Tax=Encephalitozoon cuniculi TaxID=6035 RepID=M1JM34_ENCCN|nr:hypothetical protein ECU08_2020 [Encephalitozoon cuniculi]KMV65725.1 hypothetical protein M970_082020 [Encephalitozoon cuniculi EcunIII-L]UYI27132.1 hypothetical protein J0A71_04g09840 [Encephalitozoon cuniculi]